MRTLTARLLLLGLLFLSPIVQAESRDAYVRDTLLHAKQACDKAYVDSNAWFTASMVAEADRYTTCVKNLVLEAAPRLYKKEDLAAIDFAATLDAAQKNLGAVYSLVHGQAMYCDDDGQCDYSGGTMFAGAPTLALGAWYADLLLRMCLMSEAGLPDAWVKAYKQYEWQADLNDNPDDSDAAEETPAPPN
ncbi:MAG: hypothetical protein AB7P76_00255 [Candidatus Melainabacteria bacterium]